MTATLQPSSLCAWAASRTVPWCAGLYVTEQRGARARGDQEMYSSMSSARWTIAGQVVAMLVWA